MGAYPARFASQCVLVSEEEPKNSTGAYHKMFPHWRLCAPKNGTSAVAPLNWANPAYIAYHVSVWAILPFLSRVAVSHQDLIRQCPSALMESDSRDHPSMKSVGKSRAWSLQRRPVSSRESTTQRSAGCENSSAGCCSPGAITHICIAFVSLKKKRNIGTLAVTGHFRNLNLGYLPYIRPIF